MIRGSRGCRLHKRLLFKAGNGGASTSAAIYHSKRREKATAGTVPRRRVMNV